MNSAALSAHDEASAFGPDAPDTNCPCRSAAEVKRWVAAASTELALARVEYAQTGTVASERRLEGAELELSAAEKELDCWVGGVHRCGRGRDPMVRTEVAS